MPTISRLSKWAALAAGFGLLAGCSGRSKDHESGDVHHHGREGVVVVAAKDRPEGQTNVKLKLGQTLEVRLPGQAGTGYSWRLAAVSVPGVLNLNQDQPVRESSAGAAPGSPGSEWMTFQPLAPGETTLDFVYARPWENQPPAKRFELKVEVKD